MIRVPQSERPPQRPGEIVSVDQLRPGTAVELVHGSCIKPVTVVMASMRWREPTYNRYAVPDPADLVDDPDFAVVAQGLTVGPGLTFEEYDLIGLAHYGLRPYPGGEFSFKSYIRTPLQAVVQQVS